MSDIPYGTIIDDTSSLLNCNIDIDVVLSSSDRR